MFRLGWAALLIVAFLVGYLVAPTSLYLGLACFLVPIAAFIVATVRRANAAARENNRAVSLLTEGRYVESIAAFEKAEQGMRSPLPGYNIGNANLWLWRLDEAIARIEKSTKTMAGKPLRIMAVPTLAFAAAVKNDRARAVLLEKEVETFALARSPVVLLARAVWLAREARWEEVQATLSMEVTRRLGGTPRSFADALRAWAMVNTGQPLPPIDPVGVFGETGPDALRQWWPEFAGFLTSASSR